MLVRAENPHDFDQIAVILDEAFATQGDPGAPVAETWLVETLRDTDAWIPQLSLVAVDEGEVVGYCVCTRAHVGEAAVLALGPIAVAVEVRGGGVGSALMNATIDRAQESKEPLIALLGDYRYYERFGFVPASELGIEAPNDDWGRHFQARKLRDYDPAIRGRFEYPEPFLRLP